MQVGDQHAIAQVWQACWEPVVARARILLNGRFKSVADEEDIAVCVLESVLMRAQAGDFSALNNTNSLWRLLWVVVERKVSTHVEYHLAARRSVHKTLHMSNLENETCDHVFVASNSSESMEAIALAETIDALMSRLKDPAKRTAQLALAGHSPKEIANNLNIRIWTVYYHLTYARSLIDAMHNE